MTIALNKVMQLQATTKRSSASVWAEYKTTNRIKKRDKNWCSVYVIPPLIWQTASVTHSRAKLKDSCSSRWVTDMIVKCQTIVVFFFFFALLMTANRLSPRQENQTIFKGKHLRKCCNVEIKVWSLTGSQMELLQTALKFNGLEILMPSTITMNRLCCICWMWYKLKIWFVQCSPHGVFRASALQPAPVVTVWSLRTDQLVCLFHSKGMKTWNPCSHLVKVRLCLVSSPVYSQSYSHLRSTAGPEAHMHKTWKIHTVKTRDRTVDLFAVRQENKPL